MIEILAPCGGEEHLSAALHSGADAVYLGMTGFSARRNAQNFTAAQLKNAVRLCRIAGVKVYVTLNTLVFDDELTALAKTAEQVADAGADAVIVQDLGAAKVISRAVPELALHASTQMTITSAAGAEFARKSGFKRAVLARELSHDEIAYIIRNVDIETEVFVHGALCVCVSGQCLMSAFYGGRSGNRGLCAQPCRLDHMIRQGKSERHNVLSLKDLSLIEELKELDSLGVTSAKIEGRMKRPEYVAAAVTACREVLAGKKPDTQRLRAVFSRSGFTSAYYDGTLRGMQGTRTKDDVTAGAKVFGELRKLYEKPFKRRVIDIHVTVRQDEYVTAEVSCAGEECSVVTDIKPEAALNRSVTAEEICERLSKLGETVFSPGSITASVQDGLMLSASVINSIRRAAVAAAEERLAAVKK